MKFFSHATTPPDVSRSITHPLPIQSQIPFDKATQILLALGLILYLMFSFFNISNPGMEYDESFFFAKAITDLQNRTIPIVLNCYLGALKEIIWIPIAMLSNPSEYSLRVPSVLIGFLSLLLFYVFLRNLFVIPIARISLFFLCIDPNFIFQIKYDTAPLSLSLLLRAALLYAGILFHRTKRCIYLYLLFFITGLGIYNKITYLNFAAIILLPYAFLYRKEIMSFLRSQLRNTYRVIAISALCFIAGAFPLLYVNVFVTPLCTINQIIHRSSEFHAKTTLRWDQKAKYKTGFIINSLSGDLFLNEILSGATIYSSEYFDRFTYTQHNKTNIPSLVRVFNLLQGYGLPFLTAMTFASSLFLYVSKRKRFYLYIFGSMLVWYLSSLLLSAVVYSFHILTIYPILIAYIAFILVHLAASIKIQAIEKAFLFSVFAIFLFSDLGQDFTYAYSIYVGESKGMWSRGINELSSEILAKYKHRTIYVLDWGIRPQLVILGRNTLKLKNGLDSTEYERIDEIVKDDNNIFLMHTPKYSKFRERRDEFFRLIDERQLKIKLLSETRQENGEVLFEIYGRK